MTPAQLDALLTVHNGTGKKQSKVSRDPAADLAALAALQ
jgi:hypothetical protein